MKENKKQLPQVHLCHLCTKREFPSKVPRTVRKALKPSECDICHGELSKIPELASEVTEELEEYEFETFQVGTIVPQRSLDKEDELRSLYKIRGLENFKSQITRTLASRIAKSTRKKIEYSRPELVVLISLIDHSVSLSPKSLWLEGRYWKSERGIPQRTKQCTVCSGVGCANCNFKGMEKDTVQSLITSFLDETFLSAGCNFIWIGSEDENSLVMGDGRPFFAELVRPKKRNKAISKLFGRKKKESEKLEIGHGVSFQVKKILTSKPISIPQFKLESLVHLVKAASETSTVDTASLEAMFSSRDILVDIPRKFKRVRKRIDSVKVENHEEHLDLRIKSDGGIPIRKLIQREESGITPKIGDFLNGYAIDEAQPFDILSVVILQGHQDQRERGNKQKSAGSIEPEFEDLAIETA